MRKVPVPERLRQLVGICVPLVIVASCSRQIPSDEKARAGIEQLHQLDRIASLSDKADELEKLWDPEGVRIQPGRPAEVGQQVIFDNDKRWEVKPGRERTRCGVMEVQDLQIDGDWAFEWGYFSSQVEVNGRTETSQGKVMRVMRRQRDGSWKFARVMGFPETNASAAPVSRPCR